VFKNTDFLSKFTKKLEITILKRNTASDFSTNFRLGMSNITKIDYETNDKKLKMDERGKSGPFLLLLPIQVVNDNFLQVVYNGWLQAKR
jgi:hypothetical protein